MENRNKAQEALAREQAYTGMENSLEIENHKLLGRVQQGMVYENEQGYCIVVNAIAKKADFLGEWEVEDYQEQQAKKAEQAKIAKEKKDKKIAKDKADREKKKAELEAKKEELEKE